MASMTTKKISQHTLVLTEDERLTMLAAIRYRLANIKLNSTCTAESQGLVTALTGGNDG